MAPNETCLSQHPTYHGQNAQKILHLFVHVSYALARMSLCSDIISYAWQAAKEDLVQQGWKGFYLGGNYVSGIPFMQRPSNTHSQVFQPMLDAY